MPSLNKKTKKTKRTTLINTKTTTENLWSQSKRESALEAMAGARAPGHGRFWSCYLLVNNWNRNTYIGATIDLPHRFRQHLGFLVGGAKATSRYKTWRVSMFAVLYSKKVALQFEWSAKRARGVKARRQLFKKLACELGVNVIDRDALLQEIQEIN